MQTDFTRRSFLPLGETADVGVSMHLQNMEIEMANEIDGFPLIDTYVSALGKTIELEITLESLPAGYHLTASETQKSKGKRYGYYFRSYSSESPNIALWNLRKKIRNILSVKYIDDSNEYLSLTHDVLVGYIDHSQQDDDCVIVSDGKKILMDDLKKIISTYEGFEIEIKIKEP